MKFVIQRVKEAKVEVEGKITGQIGKGFLFLSGCLMKIPKKLRINL